MTVFLYLWVLLTLMMQALVIKKPLCKIQDQFILNGLYKEGDIILGATFEISFKTVAPELSFTSKPHQWKCGSPDYQVFQWAQTMAFAIEEINKNKSLLSNITLGYRIYDNCVNLPVALRAAVSLLGGLDDSISDYSCEGLPPIVAFVGDPTSSSSIAISRILGLFRVPMVSYFATCLCLSNKKEYPSFFRTIPSDAFQVTAMMEIIKHFKWTWVGLIASDDDYGQYAMRNFNEEMKAIGCLAFSETIPKIMTKEKLLRIVSVIKESTAKIIVAFSTGLEMSLLMKEMIHQNITDRQWIASEGWSTSTLLAARDNFNILGGTLGIAVHSGQMKGLTNFLLQVRPDLDPNNNLVMQFWETMFACKFVESGINESGSIIPNSKKCTGLESLEGTDTAYSDVSNSRISYNIYKAVYSLAHALHNLMACEHGKGPFENKSCANIASLQPWQLLHYLKNVDFINQLGERVAFDENGDALAIYDIVNWQLDNSGTVNIKTIGVFDKAATLGKELYLQENSMFWKFDNGRCPQSICSASCLPGTRKAIRKGQPVCCFDCIPCANGEISMQNDSIECLQCSDDYWSNPEKTWCVLKEVEFLSYEDSMGIALTTLSLSGTCLSICVLTTFIYYRNTPVVKANNSELSFLLLISLTLCFVCALCFIGKPSHVTCMLRHVMFGISFVLCISCILVKTIVVIMAFKATLPGNNIMKWFGAAQQRGTVFFFTFIQSLICIIWLSTAPPFPARNSKYINTKIILECDIGSLTGFSCLLGYIGLLACICFLLAFLARNLPDTFNEARFITFSMLIFCAVWITFIPAYISSPGKYTVAVEIFAILASSFGVLLSIFAPKCYIILLKPEKNNKRVLMGR
ncbi:extracellular calcium-sensing receptor-like [Polypterus senegalus]|uniref:extracellular calcium-sensing receptor-like n=1 Tax=Polypterus senegalus TaxID=55291 RepID=UPI0019650C57|nr:extracellular calcium-sensing receptor-like [Polypterus senegalus]